MSKFDVAAKNSAVKSKAKNLNINGTEYASTFFFSFLPSFTIDIVETEKKPTYFAANVKKLQANLLVLFFTSLILSDSKSDSLTTVSPAQSNLKANKVR